MSELTKNIVCSLSIKVQHETYGGEKYTSTDLFESESEMVPTSMDFDEVNEVWRTLRKRVEERIQERKNALIATLQAGPPPF